MPMKQWRRRHRINKGIHKRVYSEKKRWKCITFRKKVYILKSTLVKVFHSDELSQTHWYNKYGNLHIMLSNIFTLRRIYVAGYCLCLSKQCWSWWNATFSGISSGSSLFAKVHVYQNKKDSAEVHMAHITQNYQRACVKMSWSIKIIKNVSFVLYTITRTVYGCTEGILSINKSTVF